MCLSGASTVTLPGVFKMTINACLGVAPTRPAADPAKCDFGSTPATWVRSEWPEHLGRGGDQHTVRARLLLRSGDRLTGHHIDPP